MKFLNKLISKITIRYVKVKFKMKTKKKIKKYVMIG